MTIRTLITIGFVAAVLLTTTHAFAVNTCFLDDPTNAHGLTPPIQAGGPGNDFGTNPTLCGHEVHGTNCVVEVNIDSTGSTNADCLSIGKGVTVQMQAHTIDCPNSVAPCGTAIKVTDSAGGSSKVQLNLGNVTGCWDKATSAQGTNANVDEFVIDLGGGSNCTGNGNYGVYSAFASVTHTLVKNVDNYCILGSPQSSVSDDYVHHCGQGIGTGSMSGGGATLVDHCVIRDTTDAIVRTDANLSPLPEVKDNTIYNTSNCEFAYYPPPPWSVVCDQARFNLTGTNFVEDEILF